MSPRLDAVVVGSGPNGLAAALTLAQAGHSVTVFEGQSTIGGGARTLPLTLPGFRHDLCSAIHPMAAASPFFNSLGLAQHGVDFIHSPYPLVHPLSDGRAAVLHRSVEETAAGLGADEARYLKLFKPLVEHFESIKPLIFNPITHPPRGHPLIAARFGLNALRSASDFAFDELETEEGRALMAGCAAHSFSPLTDPLTASFSLVLAVAAHAVGWPLIRGGSQSLIDALLKLLRAAGGEVEVNRPITSLRELPDSKLVLFDTHAEVMARIAGDALPAAYHRALGRFRRGCGVFKVDYALDAPVPWSASAARDAATIHLGGTLEEVIESEAAPSAGRTSRKPYVLCAQQSQFDDSRAPHGQHTFWAYCHVPNGNNDDLTSVLEAQIERFAPGFSQHVLHRSVKRSGDFETSNASYVGGDISGGSVGGLQLFARPTLRLPYTTPNPRLLICSSSAPPGPAVHGMCGHWAAKLAIKRLR